MAVKLCLSDVSDTSASSTSETSTSSESGEEEEICEESGEAEALEFSYEEDDDNLFEIDDSDESDYEEDSSTSIRQSDEFVQCPHKVFVDLDEMMKTYKKKNLSDFVTPMTKQFFRRLEISCDFLQKPPSKWKSDPEYKKSKEIVSKLKVVNDTAERGIQQMSTYNSILTKDEKTKQFLLHVVNFYNRKYKSSNIKDLAQN